MPELDEPNKKISRSLLYTSTLICLVIFALILTTFFISFDFDWSEFLFFSPVIFIVLLLAGMVIGIIGMSIFWYRIRKQNADSREKNIAKSLLRISAVLFIPLLILMLLGAIYSSSTRSDYYSTNPTEIIINETPIFTKGRFSEGNFAVSLPEGWTHEERFGNEEVAIFYPVGNTAIEAVGSKVYRLMTQAKTFEEFVEEIKNRDTYNNAKYGIEIQYEIIVNERLKTILGKGYPGIADQSSSLYLLNEGHNTYFMFVDPPFDAHDIRMIAN